MDDQFLPPKQSSQDTRPNMPGDIIMPGTPEPKSDPPFEEYHDPTELIPPLQAATPEFSEPAFQAPALPTNPEYPPQPSPEIQTEQQALPPSPAENSGIAIPEEVVEQPTAPQKKGKKLAIIAAVGVVIVVGLGMAAGLLLLKKSPKKVVVVTAPTKNDVQLIRYGILEGTMNHFAPTLDSDPGTIYVNKQVFEPLVGYENGAKIVPVLVEGWTNPDSTTWVFNLKSGVRFHTGNTLTAKDVIYSYQQYKNNPSYASTITETIKSVEAPAADQVKITTNGVDPLLLNRLANLLIVDSSAAGKVDPVYGTGPYQVKPGTTPDADHIDLASFDNFHGGHIYTKEVQITAYRTVPTQAVTGQAVALNDLKAGKLDLIGALSGNTLADAAQQSALTQLPIQYPPVFYLIPNTLKKGSPLASQKVRQAIFETLDVAAILKAQGITGTAQSQAVTKFIPGYNEAINLPTKDTVAAARLIRDAGYANGTAFTLTLPAEMMPAGTEIAAELKPIGITVKLDPQADANKVKSDGAAGKFDAYLDSDSSQYNDASDVYAREFQSKNYINPTIDSALSQAAATLNQTDRFNSLQQAVKTAMDDTALIPLYNSQQAWFSSNKSLVMAQDILKNDYGIYFYKVYSN